MIEELFTLECTVCVAKQDVGTGQCNIWKSVEVKILDDQGQYWGVPAEKMTSGLNEGSPRWLTLRPVASMEATLGVESVC